MEQTYTTEEETLLNSFKTSNSKGSERISEQLCLLADKVGDIPGAKRLLSKHREGFMGVKCRNNGGDR